MAIAYFPSLPQADILEVVFAKAGGGEVSLRLLVDSGFAGQSCFVLATNVPDVQQAPADESQLSGALQGIQKRCAVIGRIPALSVLFQAIAIVADTSPLSLPSGIHGIVGLQFLRQFRRWGAERMPSGAWQFFLET